MNRTRLMLLTACTVLLLIGAVLFSTILTAQMRAPTPDIALPPPEEVPSGGIGGALPPPMIPFDPYTVLDTSPEDARDIIATLRPPESYSMAASVEWLWGEGGSATKHFRLAVRGELFSVRELVTGGEEIRLVGDGQALTVWSGDSSSVVYTGVQGLWDVDDFCAMPTYEDLLHLPDGMIYGLSYQEESGSKYLVVYTRDELYQGQYVLSLDTGLLSQASFYDAGDEEVLVYRYNQLSFSSAVPEEEEFITP